MNEIFRSKRKKIRFYAGKGKFARKLVDSVNGFRFHNRGGDRLRGRNDTETVVLQTNRAPLFHPLLGVSCFDAPAQCRQ